VRHQHISAARHGAAWQKDAKLSACRVSGFKAAFLANVPVEDEATSFL
jgi:hypothetical protein